MFPLQGSYRRMIQRAKFLVLFLGLSILTGCSAAGGGGSTPPTATLTANPTSFTANQGSSILAFSSTNATQGSIDNGVGAVGINSQVRVTPAVTTTYTYTATGPGGTATAQATVTVTPAGPAPTVTLSASPTSIFAGQSVTLTWTSTNATSVVLDNNLGAVQPVSGGSITVSPTQTTTYTATATGDGQQIITPGTTVTVSPLTSFDGIAQDPTTSVQDVGASGAVGTKQFMEYVNTEYQAFDKVTHQPVWPTPVQFGTPWSAIPQCAGTSIQLDAMILFDRLASRWVLAAKATRPNHYYFCIAVSNTDDLSSSNLTWYAYFSDLSPYLTNPNTGVVYLPDWPKVGTWPDAYYATMDMFDTANAFEVGIVACAFDRTNMLLGVSQSSLNPMQCITVPGPLSNGIYLAHSLIPADADGATPPPAGRDEFMVSIQNPLNDGTTTTSSALNLWDFHVDWTTPSNTTLTRTSLTVDTYTPGCYLFVAGSPAITNCVAEPPIANIGQRVDSVGDRLMPRFAYRNFGTYESFLVSHTVQTGLNTSNPLQTGIRWYELRDNGTGSPSVQQQGTINPDDVLFRFLPSIAQDKVGNAAVGYNVSSLFTDPGIDFSFWDLASNDSPTEVTILNGAGEEDTPNTGNGYWSTYSSMTIDPTDDCTFWYVNEYWPDTTAWATRIAYFKLPTCQ